MFSHAPLDYLCPFCSLLQGTQGEHVYSTLEDVVSRTSEVTAFIASHQWPNNPGHVLVIPNAHYENIFDLPIHLAISIHSIVRSIATAMKLSYECDGISTRQHNEPSGGQDVWHYHIHVFPRYHDDRLNSTVKSLMDAPSRATYARKLRTALMSTEQGAAANP